MQHSYKYNWSKEQGRQTVINDHKARSQRFTKAQTVFFFFGWKKSQTLLLLDPFIFFGLANDLNLQAYDNKHLHSMIQVPTQLHCSLYVICHNYKWMDWHMENPNCVPSTYQFQCLVAFFSERTTRDARTSSIGEINLMNSQLLWDCDAERREMRSGQG